MEPSVQALRKALGRSGHHRRLLQLQGLDAALLVERFSGEEAVCGENRFRVECLSIDGYLDTDPWPGKPVTLLLERADGGQRQWHGLCSWVGELYEADGLPRYEVDIEPWTCLLQLRRNCRVFHDLAACRCFIHPARCARGGRTDKRRRAQPGPDARVVTGAEGARAVQAGAHAAAA